MRRIRVLVVDDSVVIRKLLTDILSSDPEIEVVGGAASGAIALAKIQQVNPDLVTLDVEMPGMSGLETLVELRKLYPKLPIIMFSSLTERAATTTLDALARGATDYLTKPSTGSREASIDYVRSQLLPKVRILAGIKAKPASAPVAPTPSVTTFVERRNPPMNTTPRILAVGASTGGPNALSAMFSEFPKDFPLPIVIVQHMPPLFTKLFADRMTASCALPFHEATHGELLRAGHAYVAPGDYHMRVHNEAGQYRLLLDQAPPENSCRPAVDVLFASVAEHFGAATLAVILTGMGQDGLRGCELVHHRNGQVVVQDEATSVVWGMPGFVARAGLAQAVLPLSQVATEILRRVGFSQRRTSEGQSHVA